MRLPPHPPRPLQLQRSAGVTSPPSFTAQSPPRPELPGTPVPVLGVSEEPPIVPPAGPTRANLSF